MTLFWQPKYRRLEVYKKINADIEIILRKLCEEKRVEIIETQACSDHIHMLVEIWLSLSIAQFVGFLKEKSSLLIFHRYVNLKYKYENRYFWYREYCIDTVGRNEGAIKEIY